MKEDFVKGGKMNSQEVLELLLFHLTLTFSNKKNVQIKFRQCNPTTDFSKSISCPMKPYGTEIAKIATETDSSGVTFYVWYA
jgi:hypothetical protein